MFPFCEEEFVTGWIDKAQRSSNVFHNIMRSCLPWYLSWLLVDRHLNWQLILTHLCYREEKIYIYAPPKAHHQRYPVCEEEFVTGWIDKSQRSSNVNYNIMRSCLPWYLSWLLVERYWVCMCSPKGLVRWNYHFLGNYFKKSPLTTVGFKSLTTVGFWGEIHQDRIHLSTKTK